MALLLAKIEIGIIKSILPINMEMVLKDESKKLITQEIIKGNVLEYIFDDREMFVSFISEIWLLESMPSDDPRHSDAAGDFARHLILNDDWTLEYVLNERLKLATESNETFVKFIDLLVSPKYQGHIDLIHSAVSFLTPLLSTDKVRFVLSGYQNKLPVYKLYPESSALKDMPMDVKKNDIKIFCQGTRSFPSKKENHSKPSRFPSFVLVKDNWNDFGFRTLYYLFYYPDPENCIEIGAVKIMEKEAESTQLPSEFTLLDERYCSVGLDKDYYQALVQNLGDNFISILLALRDAAFFPMIYEDFEDDDIFKKSLMRNDDTERLSRTISYSFSEGDEKLRYNFNYKFTPLFDDSATEINFPFSANGDIPKKVIALIGKNGTGKTQLLTSLARNLSDRHSPYFLPKTPLFGKVLAVSYSVFDNFEIPKSNTSFNYKYCGLKNDKGQLLDESELEIRFYDSIKKITRKKRVTKLYKVLENFIESEVLQELIKQDSSNKSEYLKFDLTDFPNIKKKLSSGQGLLLFIVVEILAELRYDSLILFDEPETHLHPNAITQLVSVIYDLVEQFDSFCLIATHSPLIIQSITSDLVYVTEKTNNCFTIRKISQESFGENLERYPFLKTTILSIITKLIQRIWLRKVIELEQKLKKKLLTS